MPKIVPIVEGDGEVDAVPELIQKILNDLSRHDIQIAHPKNAHGTGNLSSENGLERFVQYALMEKDSIGILIIQDADNKCPVDVAKNYVERINKLHRTKSVAVAIAKCEFEAWILASLETIRGRKLAERPGISEDAVCDNPEDINDAKGWISRNMPSGRSYKETLDQVEMTKLIDTGLAYRNSRSFRRLWKAIKELCDSYDNQQIMTSPQFS